MAAATVLERLLEPLADCFTPEVAHRIANLRSDAETQARLDELAAKASEGDLTEDETEEYRAYVDAIDLVGILQAKARAAVARAAASDPDAGQSFTRTEQVHVRTARSRPRVGDVVSFPYGTYIAQGQVVEDRGDLGRGGERVIRIRMDLGEDTEPLFIEIPDRVATVVSGR